MKRGHLTEYVDAVVVKRLSAVEIDPARSNQHELNGSAPLRRMLGVGSGEEVRIPAKVFHVGDTDGEDPLRGEGEVTWYDSRRAHPTRSEYRLYIPPDLMDVVRAIAAEGDSLFIARRADRSLMMIVAAAESTIERQLLRLFALEDDSDPGDTLRGGEVDAATELDLVARRVLEAFGIDIAEPEPDRLDALLRRFDGQLPGTAVFSRFARDTLDGLSPVDDPDGTLVAWLEREEMLFRRMERRRIEERLARGFGAGGEIDVDGFVAFSLSIQNSRKSRAGHAFENHIAALLEVHGIRCARGQKTENRSRPDFLFPDIAAYRDERFPAAALTMLGAKTTCKDRWRQVLTEAARIPVKHLITMEAGITEPQTDEMRSRELQLVVPRPLHGYFRAAQREWLFDVADFLALVSRRQSGAGDGDA